VRNWRSAAVGTMLAFAQAQQNPGLEIGEALRAHRYAQAAEQARAAVARNPDDVRLLTLEAIAFEGLGRLSDSLAAFDRALTLSPDYPAALEGAAELEYKAGSDRAAPLLDRLLSLQPANRTAHAMRAVIAWKQQDWEAAAGHFDLAGDAISSQPDALHEYASALAHLQRPADAIPVLRRLVDLEPADRNARYRLASAQFMAKAYADVLASLGPLIEARDPDALDLASQAWEADGDTPRAVAALRQAIVIDPSDTQLYLDFASLCVVHKSYQVGIDMIGVGLRRSPSAAELYVARGVLYVQLGRYDDADADFAKAERLDPHQGFGSLARGLSQIQQNDLDHALTTVRAELRTQHGDAFLYYLLADILTSRGAAPGSPEFQEATGAALHAVQMNPSFVLARDVLSRLYLEADQIDAAIEQCRLALRDDPEDATAIYRLMRALRKSNKPGDAEQIPALLARFNEVRQKLDQKEGEEGRYKLVEGAARAGTAQLH